MGTPRRVLDRGSGRRIRDGHERERRVSAGGHRSGALLSRRCRTEPRPCWRWRLPPLGGRAPTRGVNEPMPLEQIPAAGLLRDHARYGSVRRRRVVGNDPTWQDGGPGGRYRDYWTRTPSASWARRRSTRRTILERLIPRLKIAGQCTLTERFLVVRGEAAHVQDPPRQRQHPDGAERPVSLHRAGAGPVAVARRPCSSCRSRAT